MSACFDIPNRIIVAIGGNATHPEDIEGTSIEQKTIAARTAEALLPLALLDNELIVTHGNGPVVGKILMRQALTRDRIAPMPLDICVAHSQGGIAYLLMQAIENALRRFKRKVQQEDIIKDIKKHSFYLKPGEKRRLKQRLAEKRRRKALRRAARRATTRGGRR